MYIMLKGRESAAPDSRAFGRLQKVLNIFSESAELLQKHTNTVTRILVFYKKY